MAAKVLLVVLGLIAGISAQCNPTPTTASGSRAPGQICAGALIFNDDFDSFDRGNWGHEYSTTGGAGVNNGEFQAYGDSGRNSFAENGHLTIRPTFENGDNELHSARITTVDAFRFKYGRVEVRAKMPLGDWLWPAIWLMPAFSVYGLWPASGEIDVSEVRCNAGLRIGDTNIGIEQTGSTMHYGPYWPYNGWERAHWDKNISPGLDSDYHNYQMEWTEDHIKFSLDGNEIGTVSPPGGGFWEHGGFNTQLGDDQNPWRGAGHMAPFDQEFYVILNLAIGGTNGYFPDAATNNPPKPWNNGQPQQEAFRSFMNARGDWIPTWNMDVNNGDQNSLKVDYVKVWAL